MADEARPDEFALIERLFAPLARGEPGALGLLDDAAALTPRAGRQIVVTADAMVAGVHFLPDTPAGLVARKLLRVNLSDLAAMAATPRHYLLTAALPRDFDVAWVEAFAAGLAEDQAVYGVVMIGGDTVSTDGPLALSLTALGDAEPERLLRRGGARPGDRLFVSGTIGDAMLGLAVLRGELAGLDAADAEALAARHRLPEPRTRLGPALGGVASACIDVSDGLAADLGHVCAVSGVGARVEASRVPLGPAARRVVARDPDWLPRLLGGGDDYELLFTAPQAAADAVRAAAEASDTPVTEIGTILDRGMTVIGPDGVPLALAEAGFRHF